MVLGKGPISSFYMWISSCLIVVFLWKLLNYVSGNIFDNLRYIKAFLWLFLIFDKKKKTALQFYIIICKDLPLET